ncbi:MAG: T9SS type A sorting domain-containing protein [Crocinitomicaceae bacterium]|nr:T9SS type A sorting domain-containing protein [Crocinitomicaceae bacterium]
MKAGPIWDFDQTYGMSTVCSCNDFTGWTYLQNQPECEDLESMPAWWFEMMSDTLFTNHLACRWNELRNGPLHLDSIYNWIDTQEQYLGSALTQNFTKWPFIGQQIWSQPEPVPATYAEEITDMKDWMASRLVWMDLNLPGNCANDVVEITEIKPLDFSLYPNPANSTVTVGGLSGTELAFYSVQGQLVLQSTIESNGVSINVSDLPKGMYFVQAVLNGQKGTKKLIVN